MCLLLPLAFFFVCRTFYFIAVFASWFFDCSRSVWKVYTISIILEDFCGNQGSLSRVPALAFCYYPASSEAFWWIGEEVCTPPRAEPWLSDRCQWQEGAVAWLWSFPSTTPRLAWPTTFAFTTSRYQLEIHRHYDLPACSFANGKNNFFVCPCHSKRGTKFYPCLSACPHIP